MAFTPGRRSQAGGPDPRSSRASPGVEKFTVISGGKTVAESSELIGSPGMKLNTADSAKTSSG